MEYKPKFIEGMSVEEIDTEIKQWFEDRYRYARSIDWTRIWDLEYTRDALKGGGADV